VYFYPDVEFRCILTNGIFTLSKLTKAKTKSYRMKFKLLIAVLAFCITATSQTVPGYLWAKSATGNLNDNAVDCATDLNGNIIVTGSYVSTEMIFGNDTLTNSDTTGAYCNMFVAKYDSNGNVLWARGAGKGNRNDQARACAADAAGNVIVTGHFESDTIWFGSFALINNNLQVDMFVVKYDPNGNVLWAQRAGGSSTEYGYGCSTDAGGNVFITGVFGSASITFGTLTLNNANTSGGDIFVVKFDPLGTALWANSTGGDGNNIGWKCCTDVNSNVIVTGYYTSTTIDFGSGPLTNAGLNDVFVVSYDPLGNTNWAQSGGGVTDDYVSGCAADANGNVILTGFYMGASTTFGTTTMNSAGGWDMYVVKYSSTGIFQWATDGGGTSIDPAFNCVTDAGGNIYVAGMYQSTSIAFGSTIVPDAGTGPDIYIVKYDSNGNVLWAAGEGDSGADYGAGCAIAPNGNLVVCGYFSSATLTLGSTTLTNGGNYSNVFVTTIDVMTSIESEVSSTVVSVFPNPFTGAFIVNNANERGQLSLYNNTGALVKEQWLELGEQTISTGELTAGIYFYSIVSKEQIVSSGKLIKE
jgi:hypothetical protein